MSDILRSPPPIRSYTKICVTPRALAACALPLPEIDGDGGWRHVCACAQRKHCSQRKQRQAYAQHTPNKDTCGVAGD